MTEVKGEFAAAPSAGEGGAAIAPSILTKNGKEGASAADGNKAVEKKRMDKPTIHFGLGSMQLGGVGSETTNRQLVQRNQINFTAKYERMRMQNKQLLAELKKLKAGRVVSVSSEDALARMIKEEGIVELDDFGTGNYKTLHELYSEMSYGGFVTLEKDNKGLFLAIDLVYVRIYCRELILVETHEQMSDGRVRSRNYLPHVMKLPGESCEDAVEKWMEKELQIDPILVVAKADYQYQEVEDNIGSFYPMRSFYRRQEISYEIPGEVLQRSGEALTKIGLPGGHPFTTVDQISTVMRQLEKEKKGKSILKAKERKAKEGSYVESEAIGKSDEISESTSVSKLAKAKGDDGGSAGAVGSAFKEAPVRTNKTVKKDGGIDLSNKKEKDKEAEEESREKLAGEEKSAVHFYAWYKTSTLEAFLNAGAGTQANVQKIDLTKTIDSIFADHKYKNAYQTLLLQMFGQKFEAQKLCGGFSGSVVIRVQPYDLDGTPEEQVIVKLDAAESIREEFKNSMEVYEVLADRAAKVLGEPLYIRDKNEGNAELGAFKLELAGACWQVPEFANSSSTLLTTFKDLFVYESIQTMLPRNFGVEEQPPFGNLQTVVTELVGPNGMMRAMRKHGSKRDRAHVFSMYNLKGKDTEFNPWFTTGFLNMKVMKAMYCDFFKVDEMPDARAHVRELNAVMRGLPKADDVINMNLHFASMEKITKDFSVMIEANKAMPLPLKLAYFRPLVALGHGDLNANNVMIDAMDAVWVIDFATSKKMPLCNDMAKIEVALQFEYTIIPITCDLLLHLAGGYQSTEDHWKKLKVHDWLQVPEPVAFALLDDLKSKARPPPGYSQQDAFKFDSVWSSSLCGNEFDLDRLVRVAVKKGLLATTGDENSSDNQLKRKQCLRQLRARLTSDPSKTWNSFKASQLVIDQLTCSSTMYKSLLEPNVNTESNEGLGKKPESAVQKNVFQSLSSGYHRKKIAGGTGGSGNTSLDPHGLQSSDTIDRGDFVGRSEDAGGFAPSLSAVNNIPELGEVEESSRELSRLHSSNLHQSNIQTSKVTNKMNNKKTNKDRGRRSTEQLFQQGQESVFFTFNTILRFRKYFCEDMQHAFKKRCMAIGTGRNKQNDSNDDDIAYRTSRTRQSVISRAGRSEHMKRASFVNRDMPMNPFGTRGSSQSHADADGVSQKHLYSGPLNVVDGLAIQLHLPVLRETYRLLGYRDIPPWQKLLAAYYSMRLVEKVKGILDYILDHDWSWAQPRIPAALSFPKCIEEILENTISSNTWMSADQIDLFDAYCNICSYRNPTELQALAHYCLLIKIRKLVTRETQHPLMQNASNRPDSKERLLEIKQLRSHYMKIRKGFEELIVWMRHQETLTEQEENAAGDGGEVFEYKGSRAPSKQLSSQLTAVHNSIKTAPNMIATLMSNPASRAGSLAGSRQTSKQRPTTVNEDQAKLDNEGRDAVNRHVQSGLGAASASVATASSNLSAPTSHAGFVQAATVSGQLGGKIGGNSTLGVASVTPVAMGSQMSVSKQSTLGRAMQAQPGSEESEVLQPTFLVEQGFRDIVSATKAHNMLQSFFPFGDPLLSLLRKVEFRINGAIFTSVNTHYIDLQPANCEFSHNQSSFLIMQHDDESPFREFLLSGGATEIGPTATIPKAKPVADNASLADSAKAVADNSALAKSPLAQSIGAITNGPPSSNVYNGESRRDIVDDGSHDIAADHRVVNKTNTVGGKIETVPKASSSVSIGRAGERKNTSETRTTAVGDKNSSAPKHTREGEAYLEYYGFLKIEDNKSEYNIGTFTVLSFPDEMAKLAKTKQELDNSTAEKQGEKPAGIVKPVKPPDQSGTMSLTVPQMGDSRMASENSGRTEKTKRFEACHLINCIADRQAVIETLTYLQHLDRHRSHVDVKLDLKLKIDLYAGWDHTSVAIRNDKGQVTQTMFHDRDVIASTTSTSAYQKEPSQSQPRKSAMKKGTVAPDLTTEAGRAAAENAQQNAQQTIAVASEGFEEEETKEFNKLKGPASGCNSISAERPVRPGDGSDDEEDQKPQYLSVRVASKQVEPVRGDSKESPKSEEADVAHVTSKQITNRSVDLRMKYITVHGSFSDPVFCYGPGDRIAICINSQAQSMDAQNKANMAAAHNMSVAAMQRGQRHASASAVPGLGPPLLNLPRGSTGTEGNISGARRSAGDIGPPGESEWGPTHQIGRRESLGSPSAMTRRNSTQARRLSSTNSPITGSQGGSNSLIKFFGIRRSSRALVGGPILLDRQPIFQEVTIVDIHPENLMKYIVRYDQALDDLVSTPTQEYYLLGQQVGKDTLKDDKLPQQIDGDGQYFTCQKVPSATFRNSADKIPPENVFDPTLENHRIVSAHRFGQGTNLIYLDTESNWVDVEVTENKLHFNNCHLMRVTSSGILTRRASEKRNEDMSPGLALNAITEVDANEEERSMSRQSSKDGPSGGLTHVARGQRIDLDDDDGGTGFESMLSSSELDGQDDSDMDRKGHAHSLQSESKLKNEAKKKQSVSTLLGGGFRDMKKQAGPTRVKAVKDAIICREINARNSFAAGGLTCRLFNEEGQRLRSFMKARYGYIIDSISGTKLDVLKDCANFRLFSDQDLMRLKHIQQAAEVTGPNNTEKDKDDKESKMDIFNERSGLGNVGFDIEKSTRNFKSTGPLTLNRAQTTEKMLMENPDQTSQAALKAMVARSQVVQKQILGQSPKNKSQANIFATQNDGNAMRRLKDQNDPKTQVPKDKQPDSRMSSLIQSLTKEFSQPQMRNEGRHKACGFIVKGAPGSGKSCLIRRLVVHVVNSDCDLFPVFIALSDFAQRVTGLIKGRIRTDNEIAMTSLLRLEELFEPEHEDLYAPAFHQLPIGGPANPLGGNSHNKMNQNQSNRAVNLDAVYLIEEYLKLLHGEESMRYILLKKAICSYRVIFLFDHDATGVIPMILQRCMLGLAAMHHRIVLTCRNDSLEGSELLDLQELFAVYHIQPLDTSQQKAIITARFGNIPLPVPKVKNSTTGSHSGSAKNSTVSPSYRQGYAAGRQDKRGSRSTGSGFAGEVAQVPGGGRGGGGDRRTSKDEQPVYSAKEFMNFLEEFQRTVSSSALEDGGIDVLRSPTMLSIVLCYWQVKMKKRQRAIEDKSTRKKDGPDKSMAVKETHSTGLAVARKSLVGTGYATTSDSHPPEAPPEAHRSLRRFTAKDIAVPIPPLAGAKSTGPANSPSIVGPGLDKGNFARKVQAMSSVKPNVLRPSPTERHHTISTQDNWDAQRGSLAANAQQPPSLGRRPSIMVGGPQPVDQGQQQQAAAPVQDAEPTGETHKNSVHDVFRVAVDVLVQRMKPLKQQANRFKLKERQRSFHRALQHIAFRLQAGGKREWTRETLEKWLAPDYLEVWDEFSGTVNSGQVALIAANKRIEESATVRQKIRHSIMDTLTNAQKAMRPDSNANSDLVPRNYYRFTLYAFQKFLAAHFIGDSDLYANKSKIMDTLIPSFQVLMENQFWGDIVEVLLEKWSNKYVQIVTVKMEDWNKKIGAELGLNLLHAAATLNHLPVFTILKELPLDLRQCIHHGTRDEEWTPLHLATIHGNQEIVQLLVELNADIFAGDQDGLSPLVDACMRGRSASGATTVLLDTIAAEYAGKREPYHRLGLKCIEFAESLVVKSMSEEEFLAQIKRRFPELNYFKGPTNILPDDIYGSPHPGFVSNYYIQAFSEPSFVSNSKQDEMGNGTMGMGSETLAMYAPPLVELPPKRGVSMRERSSFLVTTGTKSDAAKTLRSQGSMGGGMGGNGMHYQRGKSMGGGSISGTQFQSINESALELAQSYSSNQNQMEDSQLMWLLPSEIESKRAWCSMLTVYWLVTDRYENFTRRQERDCRLTLTSWGFIQTWVESVMSLTDGPMIDCCLAYLAMKNLGRIKHVREDFSTTFSLQLDDLSMMTDPESDRAIAFQHAVYLANPHNFQAISLPDFNVALQEILDNPKNVFILPSYMRLGESFQRLTFYCIQLNFNFGQFILAESLPFHLLTLKEIMRNAPTTLPCDLLDFFCFMVFCDISGILGARSLDGTLSMTEEMFKNFKIGYDVLSLIDQLSVREVSDAFLANRVADHGIDFSATPTGRAMCRLVCLCRCFDTYEAEAVTEAFNQLAHHERSSLIGFLNSDGIEERPGFFVMYLSSFFYESMSNSDNAGILRALRLLLRVFELVELEYYSTHPSVISVSILELVNWAQKCTDAAEFEHTFLKVQKLTFEKPYRSGVYECVLKISKWRLFSQDTIELETLSQDALIFCRALLDKEFDEEGEFIEEVRALYPELSYFEVDDIYITNFGADGSPTNRPSLNGLEGNISQMVNKAEIVAMFNFWNERSYTDEPNEELFRRTLSVMVSIFWIVSDHYDAFVQGQPVHQQLKPASWENLRKWAVDKVGLSNVEVMDSFFVLATIHLLCGMPNFRRDFAHKNQSGAHTERKHNYDLSGADSNKNDTQEPNTGEEYFPILLHILDNYSSALPSYARLDDRCRRLVRDVIRVEFNFNSFLLTESAAIGVPKIKKVYANLRGLNDIPTRDKPSNAHPEGSDGSGQKTDSPKGTAAQSFSAARNARASQSRGSSDVALQAVRGGSVLNSNAPVMGGGTDVMEERYKSLNFYLFYLFMHHCAQGLDSDTLVDGVPSMCQAEYRICEMALQTLSGIYEKTSEAIYHEYLELRNDAHSKLNSKMDEESIALTRIMAMVYRSAFEEEYDMEEAFEMFSDQDEEGYQRLLQHLAFCGLEKDNPTAANNQSNVGAASGLGQSISGVPQSYSSIVGTEKSSVHNPNAVKTYSESGFHTGPSVYMSSRRETRPKRPLMLRGCGDFLIAAAENGSVEILSGLETLLKVYDVVDEEYDEQRKKIEVVDFTALAEFARSYRNSGSLSFNMIGLDVTTVDARRVIITPRPWVPVSDTEVLKALQAAGKTFATRILSGEITEAIFLESVNHIYPELGYFSQMDEVKNVISAMLAAYWLIMDDYRGFTRSQPPSEVLSRYSWQQMQHFVDTLLGNFDDGEYLDALFVYIAITDVCKIRHLKNDLAPTNIDTTLALGHILEHHALVLPSYWRLPDHFKTMIKLCVQVGFDFAHFLEAENLPANLNNLRELIEEDSGKRTCGFYIMQKFCMMCGNRGIVSLLGSVSMTERNYKNFKRGLEAINYLQEHLSHSYSRDIDIVYAAYDSYLQRRGVLCFTTFISKIERAIVRLACLSRAYDFNLGKKVKVTFEKLYSDERQQLTRYLNQDGISERPGFHLSALPDFLENSMQNPRVGLLRALRLMLAIFRKAQGVYRESMESVVIIHLTELVDWARDCDSEALFDSTVFSIRRYYGQKSDNNMYSMLASISDGRQSPYNMTMKKTRTMTAMQSMKIPEQEGDTGPDIDGIGFGATYSMSLDAKGRPKSGGDISQKMKNLYKTKSAANIRELSKAANAKAASMGDGEVPNYSMAASVLQSPTEVGVVGRPKRRQTQIATGAGGQGAFGTAQAAFGPTRTLTSHEGQSPFGATRTLPSNHDNAADPNESLDENKKSLGVLGRSLGPGKVVTKEEPEDTATTKSMPGGLSYAQSTGTYSQDMRMSRCSNPGATGMAIRSNDYSTLDKTEAYVDFDIETTVNNAHKLRRNDGGVGEVKELLQMMEFSLFRMDFNVLCKDKEEQKGSEPVAVVHPSKRLESIRNMAAQSQFLTDAGGEEAACFSTAVSEKTIRAQKILADISSDVRPETLSGQVTSRDQSAPPKLETQCTMGAAFNDVTTKRIAQDNVAAKQDAVVHMDTIHSEHEITSSIELGGTFTRDDGVVMAKKPLPKKAGAVPISSGVGSAGLRLDRTGTVSETPLAKKVVSNAGMEEELKKKESQETRAASTPPGGASQKVGASDDVNNSLQYSHLTNTGDVAWLERMYQDNALTNPGKGMTPNNPVGGAGTVAGNTMDPAAHGTVGTKQATEAADSTIPIGEVKKKVDKFKSEKVVKKKKLIKLTPNFLQNWRSYIYIMKDLVGLHITTSCYSIWKKHGFNNSGGKVIPAFSRHDPDLPHELRHTHVFFFDDNLEFNGGREQDSGIVSLRDLNGNFISFGDGHNGYSLVSYKQITGSTDHAVDDDGSGGVGGMIVQNVRSTKTGIHAMQMRHMMSRTNTYAGRQSHAPGSRSNSPNMDSTVICFSTRYNCTLVRVNLLDALMDDQYFTNVVRKFSRPGEKCLINVDINATIIFGDLISGKDEAHVLTSTMFESISVTPQTAYTFRYLGKEMELECGKKYYAKKIVRQMFSKEEARKCFNQVESRKLLAECLNAGDVTMGEKVITLEDFERLYHDYAETMKRTVEKGIVRSWFELHRQFKDRHVIMLNTFGVDSLRVIETTLSQPKQVNIYLANYEMWSKMDRGKFLEQFLASRRREELDDEIGKKEDDGLTSKDAVLALKNAKDDKVKEDASKDTTSPKDVSAKDAAKDASKDPITADSKADGKDGKEGAGKDGKDKEKNVGEKERDYVDMRAKDLVEELKVDLSHWGDRRNRRKQLELLVGTFEKKLEAEAYQKSILQFQQELKKVKIHFTKQEDKMKLMWEKIEKM